MNARYLNVVVLLFCLSLPSGNSADKPPQLLKSAGMVSKAAAERCSTKLKSLEDFAAQRKAGRKQTMRFSQDEINSYLALDLSPHYHPCLKGLSITLKENMLQAVASIDFDHLGSSKFVTKILGFLFSATHQMTATGQIISQDGNAYFRLDQARFDGQTLPNHVVEEIISAVGRRQDPPFDPLQPSKLMYEIEKVEVHAGYIIVYQ
jgi:hypothetical protein